MKCATDHYGGTEVQVGNDSWRTLRDTVKKGIHLALSPDGSVGNIYLPGSDGKNAWAYSPFSQETSGGSATAVKSDKTYTVTGKVIGIDNKASGAFRDFEVTVTCP